MISQVCGSNGVAICNFPLGTGHSDYGGELEAVGVERLLGRDKGLAPG